MTRLWLVRHGPTHAKVMVGWSDIPADLTDTAALARLRAFLPAAPVVSSDLSRAVATADTLQPVTRLPHDPALREINFGAWEMRSFDAVAREDRETIRAYWETPGDIAPPGGESWNMVCDRVNRAVDSYLAAGYADLIIVAHFGVILTQLQRARGVDAYTVFGQKIDNLSVTRLSYDADAWQVAEVNHCP